MFRVMADEDVSYMDKFMLDEDGRVQMVPAAVFDDIPQEHISIWCVRNAVYQIPTTELVEWLSQRIGKRRTIEICSGKNDLGARVGVKMTDSYLQTRPEIVAHYRMAQQEPITPPHDVAKREAVQAVKMYKPEVVIGAFVTHRWREGMAEGNPFGPDEEAILGMVDEYIHVGNLKTHHAKPLLKQPHEELAFPWLVSRAFEPEYNRIMIWNKQ